MTRGDHNDYLARLEGRAVTEYVCEHCGESASFERQSVTVWEGEMAVGNALVLTCSECSVLQEVLSAPTGN